MMVVEPVENYLQDLTLCPLRCLLPDGDTYSTMLLQPDGPFEASEDRIGHHNKKRGADLCRLFLLKSVEEHAHLVITPEYCMPWEIINELAIGSLDAMPNKGSIWVLGCESISIPELNGIKSRLQESGHFVHFEDINADEVRLKSYVDPLVYVFWCLKPDSTPILCFVVQFKTIACSDKLNIEQRSLCKGKLVYTFNRGVNKIGLMTIICSDSFNFDETLVNEYHRNMLLIHIQVNPKPAHPQYSRYRTQLYSVASKTDFELLCLNWSANIKEFKSDGTEQAPWENNSGSGYYLPPAKFNPLEDTIKNAHQNGMYYSLIDLRWHVLYLNHQPHAILLNKQKVMMVGVALVVEPLSCASVKERWTWDSNCTVLSNLKVANDGFEDFLAPFANLVRRQEHLTEQSPFAVERALEMLVGAPRKSDSWFDIKNLESMHVADGESLRRITVNQDTNSNSMGAIFRKQRLTQADAAISLPGNNINWPLPLKDLEDGFLFSWSANNPFHNVLTTSSSAGLVYLSDQSSDDDAKKIYSIISNGTISFSLKMASESNKYEVLTKCNDRLCVVYRKNQELKILGVDSVSQIDRPPESISFNIAGNDL